MYIADPKKFIYEVLALSEAEQNIIELATGIARSASTIAYHAKVPVTSMPRILKRLQKRHLIIRIGDSHKQVRWRSNMTKVLREFHREYEIFMRKHPRPR